MKIPIIPDATELLDMSWHYRKGFQHDREHEKHQKIVKLYDRPQSPSSILTCNPLFFFRLN